MTGLAAALLAFTGFWHMTEWLMGGRNRDTLRLVPVGLVYLILGFLFAAGTGGWIVRLIALLLTAAGMAGAFMLRNRSEVRPWVTWAFILIDVVIVVALAVSLV